MRLLDELRTERSKKRLATASQKQFELLDDRRELPRDAATTSSRFNVIACQPCPRTCHQASR